MPIDEKFGLNPPIGAFITAYQGQRVREFIGPDWASALQAISDGDENVVGIAKQMQALPDLNRRIGDSRHLRRTSSRYRSKASNVGY
jgi:hypothetical protein